jgi:hypothetical protein
VTPGRQYDQSTSRSEIGGIYAMTVAIELICKFFHISNGSVIFLSECQAVLYCIFDKNKTATATTKYFDLIMATIKVLYRLPIKFSHRHIPAHQDISREEMDIWGEQMMIVIQTIRPSGNRKKQHLLYSHQQTSVMNHGHCGYTVKNYRKKM